MKLSRMFWRLLLPAAMAAGVLAVAALPAGAKPLYQSDAVAQGKYLTTVAGCIDCHTPYPADFNPASLTSLDVLYSLAGGADKTRLFAGGQPFDLGPLGVVFSKNLTPDPETGLGNWTDDEIKTAFQTGVSKDGLHLFPVMPFHTLNGMADSDASAVVAFLRTLAPVKNAVPRTQILPPEALPQLPRQTGVVAPDPKDTAARGKYLVTSVIACNDCHTPVDPQTGAPVMEKYLAGGQPFAGPWGTIYGGNITPDKATGIGSWSDADIKRVIKTGVRPDGRKVVLMPWQLFASLTDDDLNAIVSYLRNDVPAVSNEVPKAALNPGFEVVTQVAQPGPSTTTLLLIGAVVVVVVGGAFLLMRRRGAAAPPKA
jgi:mono/diheme cytochrome c family protein